VTRINLLSATAAAGTYVPATDLPAVSRIPTYVLCGADAPALAKSRADYVSDGTSASDTTGWTNALAAAPGKQIEVWGTFVLNAPVSGTAAVITGRNGATVYTPDSATPGLQLGGSRTDLTATISGTTLAQGTQTLTYTGSLAATVSAGDYIALTTTQAFGGSIAERPGENFSGEMLRVYSHDTTNKILTFDTLFRESYPVSGMKLYLYNFPATRTVITGLRVVAPGSTGHPLTTATSRCRPFVVSYSKAPFISDVSVSGDYAREGVAFYECWTPTAYRCTAEKVNDLAGTNGTYEAYAFRAMGCEEPVFDLCYSLEGRHGFEINGGQTGYGLSAGNVRPITYRAAIRNCTARHAWGAGAGDHPGSAFTRFESFTAWNCSGGIFVRGRNASITGDLTYVGAHHSQGPYSANQGNDHAITIGEQLRDSSGTARTDTHGGWCGTGLYIDVRLNMDLTGVSGATCHVLHSVHPLDNATIRIGGRAIPTGNGINIIGDYTKDADIEMTGLDLSSAYSGTTNGWFFRFAPATTSPATTTGQTCQGLTLNGSVRKPRMGVVYIAGNAANDSNVTDGTIDVDCRGLHSSWAGTQAIVFGSAPDGTTTGRHGQWTFGDNNLPNFTAANGYGLSTATMSTPPLWGGRSRFSDGYRISGIPRLPTGQVRHPQNTNMATVTVATGDRNALFLFPVFGCGQTFSGAHLGCTNAGTVASDGAGVVFRVGAYADDGTGSQPALAAALYDSGALSPSTTGWITGGAAFTEPVGKYWLGVVLQYTGTPTTLPTMVSISSPILGGPAMAAAGFTTTNTGTNVNQPRSWKQTGVTGALPVLTALTQDVNARVIPGLVV
jgi:hypothetical protein